MSTSLLADAQAFRARLGRLDEALLGGEDCAVLVEELALVGKSCDAARSRLAARAESTGAHRRRGFLDGADWLAGLTGTNTGEARRAMELIGALQACPTTGDAFAAGELSVAQASEIARTEAVRPGSEAELLYTARRAPLRVLRERASRRRLESVDADELARRQRRARYVKHFRDDLGMTRIQAALTPEAGVALLARLDAETERLRRKARQAGEAEPWEAHAADALVGLAVGDGQARGARRKADVVFVCDIGAYRRGRAEEGEACHLLDAGPVPVAAVRAAVDDDAFVKIAFHDGVEIQKVKHFGRHIGAELRTALELGPPPAFEGRRCGCGCGKRYKLQNDHLDPVANGGPTSFANLEPRVAREHVEKTRRDREAGLLGPRRRRRRGDRDIDTCPDPP